MSKKPLDPKEEHKPLFPVEEMTTMSGTDMTGLIPSGMENYEDVESYEELYPFIPNTGRNGFVS